MVRSVRDWLLGDELTGLGMVRAGDKICRELRRQGIPVDRTHFLALLLHPLFHGRSHIWTPERGGWVEEHPHGLQNDSGWVQSVFWQMLEGQVSDFYAVDLRSASEMPRPLPTLREQGFTGYLAMSWRDSDGHQNVISFATRAEEGFSPAVQDRLRMMREPLAFRSEISLKRDFIQQALATYIGEEPARRVLSGSIRRGDVEEIEAVIWFSDLRDFTELSETRAASETADLLGDYFQAVVDVVRGYGGEVLKFMGDGVLAIFRIENRDLADVCSEAAEAALTLTDTLSKIDLQWQERGARCQAGVALHVGTVSFGNVGASDRLDFTVIGPAVNLASRVEGCGKEHGVSIVVTEAFAEKTKVATRYLGTYSLKGLPAPERVFTLAATDENA